MEEKVFMPPPPKELKKTQKHEQPEIVKQEPIVDVESEPQENLKKQNEKKHHKTNWGLLVNICGFILAVGAAAVCIYFLVK